MTRKNKVKKPMKHQPVDKPTFDKFIPLQFNVPVDKTKTPKLKFEDIFAVRPTKKPPKKSRP